ncbi:MAG: replication-relaxation family protein [Patescibacteria group bacterium]
MRPSRFIRPDQATGLVLQPRDRAILVSVFKHRFMCSDHLHQVLCPNVCLRVLQVRLRKLWEHQMLDRHFIPFVLDGVHKPPKRASQPIYSLAPAGAAALDEESRKESEQLAKLRPAGSAPALLEHNLVATDFLVSVQAACRGRADVQVECIEAETSLWRKVWNWRQRTGRDTGFIIPDAAVVLRLPATGERLAFYLEVIRSDIKGGNRRLLVKLKRYTELLRQGFFRQAFGHERVRAVLVATSTETRAQNLNALAQELAHGRRLFWFGAYEHKDSDGRGATNFTAGTTLSPMWRTIEGELVSLEQGRDKPPA